MTGGPLTIHDDVGFKDQVIFTPVVTAISHELPSADLDVARINHLRAAQV